MFGTRCISILKNLEKMNIRGNSQTIRHIFFYFRLSGIHRLLLWCSTLGVLVLSIPAFAQEDCPVSLMKIDKLRVANEGNMITSVFGVILNGCSISAGPQIKVTFYDNAENILYVKDTWPANVNNIPSKSDFPFQLTLNRVENYTKIDVRVISAKKW